MKYNFTGYRSFRNQQEKKAYYAEPDLVRHKRRPNRLPNDWENEYYITPSKSWKKNRKTQYREDRGQKNEIVLPTKICTWSLKEFLFDQDIPFVIEEDREKRKTQCWWGSGNGWYWCSITIRTRLIWWSTKDIGIDYILRKFNYE